MKIKKCGITEVKVQSLTVVIRRAGLLPNTSQKTNFKKVSAYRSKVLTTTILLAQWVRYLASLKKGDLR